MSESVEYIGNNAFAQCENIEDVFCFAEKLPETETSAFDKSYPEYATLHVPAVAISKYKSTAPWSSFGKIVALSDGDEPVVPEQKKCAIPTISYINGELVYDSETEGVDFVSEITDTDIKKHYNNKIKLTATYNIRVYATKEGYKDSEVAKVHIFIDNSSCNLFK